MKVMVLSPYLPHARVGHGGGTAVRGLVSWLARNHEVLLVTLQRPGEQGLAQEVEDLAPAGRLQVVPIDFTDNMARGRRRLNLLGNRLVSGSRAALTGYPFYVTKYWSKQLSKRVLQLASQFQPDAIQVEYLQMSLLLRDLCHWRDRTGNSKPRLILNTHELGSVPRQRRAHTTSSPLQSTWLRADAAAWQRLQVKASHWADTTLCVTPGDHEKFAAMGGVNLETVPLGMDLEDIQARWQWQEPERFLFVGSFGHGPNVNAARFLLEKVWPVIHEARPEARLVIAGRGSDSWLTHWRVGHQNEATLAAANSVDALGFVDDVATLFSQCRLFLAPLCQGGGIKIKILEAMARGIPVVTTEIGSEGICSPQDNTVYLAECHEEFATKALEALADWPETQQRAKRARQLIEKDFSWESITARLAEFYR